MRWYTVTLLSPVLAQKHHISYHITTLTHSPHPSSACLEARLCSVITQYSICANSCQTKLSVQTISGIVTPLSLFFAICADLIDVTVSTRWQLIVNFLDLCSYSRKLFRLHFRWRPVGEGVMGIGVGCGRPTLNIPIVPWTPPSTPQTATLGETKLMRKLFSAPGNQLGCIYHGCLCDK
jgi:hypothetical protein